MDADFTRAADYVVAEHRDIVKALALSSGPGTLLQMSGSVRVGRLDVEGDAATAVFTGRLCRIAVGSSGGPDAPDCVENMDAAAEPPIFTVHLSRAGTAGWQVALPIPVDG